jgi:hypothetical protein
VEEFLATVLLVSLINVLNHVPPFGNEVTLSEALSLITETWVPKIDLSLLLYDEEL